MYVINDELKYIIVTFAKSGCSTVRIIHTYLMNDNDEDKHHGIQKRDMIGLKDEIDKYSDYKKIMVYRNPYNRIASLYYQKICGIKGITRGGKYCEEPYRLTEEVNTFNKFLDKLNEGYYDEDLHFLPQKIPFEIDRFDQIIELSEIDKIFLDVDNQLNERIKNIMGAKRWNELSKYEYEGYLSDYDFHKDVNEILKDNKIPKYDTKLNEKTMEKIRNGYGDDFIENYTVSI